MSIGDGLNKKTTPKKTKKLIPPPRARETRGSMDAKTWTGYYFTRGKGKNTNWAGAKRGKAIERRDDFVTKYKRGKNKVRKKRDGNYEKKGTNRKGKDCEQGGSTRKGKITRSLPFCIKPLKKIKELRNTWG